MQAAALLETVWSTIGVGGLAALWAVKLAITAVVYRLVQKKSGFRGPLILGWLYRQIMRRRAGHETNGH